MPVVRSDGVDIAYDRAGPSDAEAVVFVEGWSYGRWMWNWQREALDDYRTLVPDNRGTGESAAPGLGMGLFDHLPETLRQLLVLKLHREKYTIERMAADLDAVLADAGVDSAHVVGASMGGMIALQHALDFDRTETLALMCTTAGGEMADLLPEETQEHLDSVPEGLDERERVKYLMEPATSADWREANPDVVEDIVDWRLEQDAGPAARDAQALGQLGYDVRDRLGEVEAPTLVMHGTGDDVVPFARGEELAAGLDCEFETFEDGSHLFFVERANAVNDRLRAFLEDAA